MDQSLPLLYSRRVLYTSFAPAISLLIFFLHSHTPFSLLSGCYTVTYPCFCSLTEQHFIKQGEIISSLTGKYPLPSKIPLLADKYRAVAPQRPTHANPGRNQIEKGQALAEPTFFFLNASEYCHLLHYPLGITHHKPCRTVSLWG